MTRLITTVGDTLAQLATASPSPTGKNAPMKKTIDGARSRSSGGITRGEVHRLPPQVMAPLVNRPMCPVVSRPSARSFSQANGESPSPSARSSSLNEILGWLGLLVGIMGTGLFMWYMSRMSRQSVPMTTGSEAIRAPEAAAQNRLARRALKQAGLSEEYATTLQENTEAMARLQLGTDGRVSYFGEATSLRELLLSVPGISQGRPAVASGTQPTTTRRTEHDAEPSTRTPLPGRRGSGAKELGPGESGTKGLPGGKK